MGNSILSGVSGLQAHQKMLDVAGNNLANVNTTAFKSSRVTFSDLLSETIRDAGQSNGQAGGTNPIQVGSGVQLASIDRDMAQGSLMNTGKALDMAIEGSGYFVVTDAAGNDLYTRAGAFAVDGEYYLVDPSTGYRVKRTGSEGTDFQSPTNQNIRIPYDTALSAKATQSISFTGNLSADDNAATANVLGSGIQYTQDTAMANDSSLLKNLDQAEGLATGDKIAITGTRRDGTSVNAEFTISADPTERTLSSLVKYTTAPNTPATAATVLTALEQASGLQAGDKIEITGTDSNGDRVSDTYTYAGGDTLGTLLAAINGAYSGGVAAIGADGQIVMTDNVAGASQTTLNLSYVGSGTFTLPGEFDVTTTGAAGSTVGDLLDFITNSFADPTDPLDKASTASLVGGEIRLSDDEAGYSKTNMDLRLVPTDGGSLQLPEYFQLLSAGGQSSKNVNVSVFDSKGISHTLSAAFVRTNTPDSWDLVLTSMTGGVDVTKRRIEGINFLSNGSFAGVTNNAPATFEIDLNGDGVTDQTLSMNLGDVGNFNGLSQFGGASTVAPSDQDGYAPGWLSSISVSSDGVLSGVFTNGQHRDLAAIQIATFRNPEGLQASGGNYWVASGNSGNAVVGKGLEGTAGAVRGGSLEKSNVDMATEFVNLIEAQNGFQANARTIRVANELLQQLTNLIQ